MQQSKSTANAIIINTFFNSMYYYRSRLHDMCAYAYKILYLLKSKEYLFYRNGNVLILQQRMNYGQFVSSL